MEDSFADELPPLTDPDVAFSSGSGEDTDSGAEGVEEAESVGEEAPSSPSSSADRHRAETSGDAGLDALPDISTLGTPSAGRAAEQSAAQGRRSASRDTPEDAMRGKLGGQDPATLARAIRTVLKRDEKG